MLEMPIKMKDLKTLVQINLKTIMKNKFNVLKHYIKSVTLNCEASYHGVYASDKEQTFSDLPKEMKFIVGENENWFDKHDFVKIFGEDPIDIIRITNTAIAADKNNLELEVDHPKQENI